MEVVEERSAWLAAEHHWAIKPEVQPSSVRHTISNADRLYQVLSDSLQQVPWRSIRIASSDWRKIEQLSEKISTGLLLYHDGEEADDPLTQSPRHLPRVLLSLPQAAIIAAKRVEEVDEDGHQLAHLRLSSRGRGA